MLRKDKPVPATFILSLDLGNAAMREPEDVAKALGEIRDHLLQTAQLVAEACRDEGVILDENGNTVGRWKATWPGRDD